MTDIPMTNNGISPLALQADTRWDADDRPLDWQGRVFGLVVHTTGGDLPASADELGVYHTVRAVQHYSASHGCHYVNGWAGADGGDLLQLANEREQAAGVGVTNAQDPSKDQRRSIDAGRFEADLPPVLVRLWRERWPSHDDSLALLPGTRTANSCYVHVECVPCVYHAGGKRLTGDGVEPMRPGLRFTEAQHATVAALAIDVARRNNWPVGERWWRSARLLGHEDLTPISRHDSQGGWDPGYLREAPYFDWDDVYRRIEQAVSASSNDGPSLFDLVGNIGTRLADLVADGQDHLAVALARQQGTTDVDELTNLLFFARHPEMGRRRIAPEEAALAQEWIDIRDTVVRPTLDPSGSEEAAR